MSLLEYLSSLEDIREEKERQRKEKIEQERQKKVEIARLKQEQTWRENGMCEKCGKKLGFFEKLAGNIRCESCRKKS
jgi:molybdenum cofactor biosynthesis enzyme MoaA